MAGFSDLLSGGTGALGFGGGVGGGGDSTTSTITNGPIDTSAKAFGGGHNASIIGGTVYFPGSSQGDLDDINRPTNALSSAVAPWIIVSVIAIVALFFAFKLTR